jgi:hypothetical protein
MLRTEAQAIPWLDVPLNHTNNEQQPILFTIRPLTVNLHSPPMRTKENTKKSPRARITRSRDPTFHDIYMLPLLHRSHGYLGSKTPLLRLENSKKSSRGRSKGSRVLDKSSFLRSLVLSWFRSQMGWGCARGATLRMDRTPVRRHRRR